MQMEEPRAVPTRERILEAASSVFSEKGFEKATVRDICSRAGANVAGVNYHFGDKLGLYRELLGRWLDRDEERFPLDEDVDEKSDVARRLFVFYRAMLLRIFSNDPNGATAYGKARVWLSDLVGGPGRQSQQGANTSRKFHEHLGPIIRDAVGEVDGQAMDRIMDNLLGLILTYFVGFVYRPEDYQQFLDDPGSIDDAARYMTQFALGGLGAVKENING